MANKRSAKELGLRSDFVSPDDEPASVRKPCKTTKPQLFGYRQPLATINQYHRTSHRLICEAEL